MITWIIVVELGVYSFAKDYSQIFQSKIGMKCKIDLTYLVSA